MDEDEVNLHPWGHNSTCRSSGWSLPEVRVGVLQQTICHLWYLFSLFYILSRADVGLETNSHLSIVPTLQLMKGIHRNSINFHPRGSSASVAEW